MEIKKKSAVYALQEENENFVLTADLTVDLNNRLVANGTVRSRVTPERGFTFYYQTAEDGTVSYSTAGCPNCEATATEFVYSVVRTATQQIHADSESQSENAQESLQGTSPSEVLP
jgi:hypothetical protein